MWRRWLSSRRCLGPRHQRGAGHGAYQLQGGAGQADTPARQRRQRGSRETTVERDIEEEGGLSEEITEEEENGEGEEEEGEDSDGGGSDGSDTADSVVSMEANGYGSHEDADEDV